MFKCTCNLSSSCIDSVTELEIVMPQPTNAKVMVSHQPGKFRCLYLLHGLGDNGTVWSRLTHIEWLSYEYGIAIVMPTGGRSFYTNMKYGPKYYDYITKELPKFVESMFPVSSDPRDRFIGGNSMGGYGALKCGLREEGFYAGVAALSPVTDIVKRASKTTGWDSMDWVFGEDRVVPKEDNLYDLVNNCKKRPKLFCGIGTADFLYEEYLNFTKKLRDVNYDFKEVLIPEATLNWSVWETLIHEALPYFFPENEVEYTILP